MSKRTAAPAACLVAIGTLVPVLALAPTPAPAQSRASYPSQPIRLVVPNPPGGLPDIMIRMLTDHLRDRLGQPMLVENRPGASAGVGAAVVATSKPDGYTFLVSDSSIISVGPRMQKQVPYDPKALVPASLIARGHVYLAATAQLPPTTLKELVDYIKANPDKLNYGSIGVGSFHHLTMEAMRTEFGLRLNHIPYKGSGESVTALRGGHIDLVLASYAALLPAVKSQQAKLIASNGAARGSQTPQIPAIAELIAGLDLSVTQTLYARAGTPPEHMRRIAAVVAEVVKLPDIVQRFAVAGLDPVGGTGEDMARILERESTSIPRLIDAAGIKPN